MNKLVLSLACAMLVGSVALAAEVQDHKAEDKTTTSTNMMGTKTTKHKVTKQMKGADGKKSDVAVTETTKEKKDGTVKKDVEVKASSTDK